MTIDEAIKYSKEVAERYERMEDSHDDKLKDECLQCAAGHRELAEWLKELKERRAADVKRGKWEKKSSVGVFRCSLCHHIFMLGADEIDEYHFCPNCGADMREHEAKKENLYE